jgi:hypothetical protein
VGGDERETLVGAGPVAELNLGGVPADELEGGVAEVLEPLFGVAGRLDVRRDATAEPALLMITLPCQAGPVIVDSVGVGPGEGAPIEDGGVRTRWLA